MAIKEEPGIEPAPAAGAIAKREAGADADPAAADAAAGSEEVPGAEPNALAITLDLAAPSDGVERALFGGASTTEDSGSEEWEDVAPEQGDAGSNPGAAAAAAAQKAGGWRDRMAQRQQFWSTSHGFKMGRKLGEWGADGEEEAAAAPAPVAGAGRSPAKARKRGGSAAAAAAAAAAGGGGGHDDEEALLQEAIRRSLQDAGGWGGRGGTGMLAQPPELQLCSLAVCTICCAS